MTSLRKFLKEFFDVAGIATDYFGKLKQIATMIVTIALFILAHRIFQILYWLAWGILFLFILSLIALFRSGIIKYVNQENNHIDLKVLSERFFGYKLDSRLYQLLKNEYSPGRFPVTLFQELESLKVRMEHDPISLFNKKLTTALQELTESLDSYLEASADYLFQEGQYLVIGEHAMKVDLNEGRRQMADLASAGARFLKSYEGFFDLIHSLGGHVREKTYIAS